MTGQAIDRLLKVVRRAEEKDLDIYETVYEDDEFKDIFDWGFSAIDMMYDEVRLKDGSSLRKDQGTGRWRIGQRATTKSAPPTAVEKEVKLMLSGGM